MPNKVKNTQVRAVDPDPHGSAFIFPPVSGSRRDKIEAKTEKNARKKVIIIINFFKLK